jgi:hypothetical protein
MTKHGWFSFQELGEVDAKLTTDDHGRRLIRFPVAYEWSQGKRWPIYRDIPDHIIEVG